MKLNFTLELLLFELSSKTLVLTNFFISSLRDNMSYELAAVRFMEKHQWKLLHFAAYTDWPEETIKVLLKTIQIPNPSNIDIDELAEVINQCYKLCYELNFVHVYTGHFFSKNGSIQNLTYTKT